MDHQLHHAPGHRPEARLQHRRGAGVGEGEAEEGVGEADPLGQPKHRPEREGPEGAQGAMPEADHPLPRLVEVPGVVGHGGLLHGAPGGVRGRLRLRGDADPAQGPVRGQEARDPLPDPGQDVDVVVPVEADGVEPPLPQARHLGRRLPGHVGGIDPSAVGPIPEGALVPQELPVGPREGGGGPGEGGPLGEVEVEDHGDPGEGPQPRGEGLGVGAVGEDGHVADEAPVEDVEDSMVAAGVHPAVVGHHQERSGFRHRAPVPFFAGRLPGRILSHHGNP